MKTRYPLAAYLAVLLAWSATGLAEEPLVRQVTTTGEAVLFVTPDEVVITFGVQIEDADLDKAVAGVEERSATLLRELRRLDLPENQIATTNLDISPQRDHQNRKAGVIGYSVRRTYTVTLKRVPEFEKLVRSALKAGANELVGFEFRSSKMREKRDEARRMACRAAKEKAQLMAGELGVKVGKPITISEDGASFYSRPRDNVFTREDMEGGDESNMPSGQIPMRAKVTVSFELE